MEIIGRMAVVLLCVVELFIFPINELMKRQEEYKKTELIRWVADFESMMESDKSISTEYYGSLSEKLGSISDLYDFEWMVGERAETFETDNETGQPVHWKIRYRNELENELYQSGVLKFASGTYWSIRLFDKHENVNGYDSKWIYCSGGKT